MGEYFNYKDEVESAQAANGGSLLEIKSIQTVYCLSWISGQFIGANHVK
jgi:hypothetical protein